MKDKNTFYLYRFKPNKKNDKYVDTILNVLEKKGYKKIDDGEIVFIFGGDGSLFHNAFETDYKKKYCLINCGHLGFFADYNVNEFASILEKSTSFIEESIPCFKLKTSEGDINFVNDIYITENRPLDFDILVNGTNIVKQKANGIALGTSVGSSGYLYSLNSPLVLTNNDVLQFSLLAPIRNKTSNNFITKGILSSNDVIEIKLSNKCELFHDGIKLDYEVDNFIISKSNKKMTLLHFNKVNNIDRILKSFK